MATSATCVIRGYLPGEAATLLELFRDTVRRINCRDYAPPQIAAWVSNSIDPQAWEQQFINRCTLVAERHGQIVGFADMQSNGHLDGFYVHADCQRQGIGNQLFAKIEAEASRLGLPHVFTEASITARPFFERQGFRVLAQQEVSRLGVVFINFRMEKKF